MTRRGDAVEMLAGETDPGAATRNFLDALGGRGSVACSFTDAIVATGIVERAFESAHGNCTWLPLALER